VTSLFHVSDLHFGYEDREALDWFAGEVERIRPAAVICTGDLTMRGTAREFARAQEWLKALPVPVTVEPGNHDVPYYWNPLARMVRPYRHYRNLEAVLPLKTIGRAQFRLNWSKGRIRASELEDTLRGLDRTRTKTLRLVTCHHPLVDADTESRGSTRGGRRALAALAQAGADAVLSGHVHDPFDLEIDAGGRPIRMIGAGTLSQRLRKTSPSFNRLTFENGDLRVVCETLP
jgi:3',5'-cyclic AMP phosphodiesterase CpdA